MKNQKDSKLIIFVRHGQAENNTKKILAGRTPGISLTEKGITQAESAGKFMKSLNISKIYSSPVERAKSTADIISKHCNAEVVVDERLTELDMGKFTMMPYEEIFAMHGNVFLKFYDGNPAIKENGVETFDEVKKRISEMVDFVIEKHHNENIVLVTHMDPIKAILSIVLNLRPENLFELIIANASLTIDKHYDGKFSLTAINAMDSERYNHTF